MRSIKLTPADPTYPARLRTSGLGPSQLWISGTLPPDAMPVVGIVGTRRLTPYGQRMARELALATARAGAVVVSGLAQGIDSVSHAAALEADGLTIAVLGEGLSHFEEHGPLSRRRLARAIRNSGALVSEYALDVRPSDWTFPRRNATIAGLADVLVVVEAPVGSGALITAERMRAIGRPVFAVPGPVGAPTWTGSNRLVSHGAATLLADAAQLLGALGLSSCVDGERPAGRIAARLLTLLAAGPADADTVAARLGLSRDAAATLLADQMILGAVIPTPDGRFARR